MPALALGELANVVSREVSAVEAIDVHTHILPPNHGQLMLFGIDALLTYHYLVAETFMVLPTESEADSSAPGPGGPPSKEEFFSWPQPRQAELVFDELFVKRTPLSEACRGVITVLSELGLSERLREAAGRPASPRLGGLREWFAQQDPVAYLEHVCTKAKVRYAVMTNIPFVAEEAAHWQPSGQPSTPLGTLSPRLKTALRVDPFLAGDWNGVRTALRRNSPPHEETLEGCKAYLRQWIEILQPLYLMASTPAGFAYSPTRPRGKKRTAQTAIGPQEARDETAGAAALVPTATQLLEEALLAVASEASLPLALKIGAVRGANPALQAGGDGVEVADLRWLRELLLVYPHIKFLVTVLSRDNQHELAVLARKFGNLHVYGCWWFCNNPSIIEDTTRMRLEMLGTAFTCQHSDARVLDQLLYKWKHSREAVGPVLAAQYRKLLEAGWDVTEDDVKRDVGLLFGGSFEQFLAK